VASRPWVVFEDAFSQKPNLQLHDLTYPDIHRFSTSLLRSNPYFPHLELREPERAGSLIEAVTTRAAGVFLWVDLAVNSLLSGLSNRDRMSDLQRRLEEIPPDLERFYEKIFDGIESIYMEHACQLFQLASEAEGSMTVLQLSFADDDITVDDFLKRPTGLLSEDGREDRFKTTKRRLNSRCKGFLEIPTASHSGHSLVDSKVTYLHRTARDFLLSSPMKRGIAKGVDESFDPVSLLFHASIMHLKVYDGEPISESDNSRLWSLIDSTMVLASRCEAASLQAQTRLLKEIDHLVTEITHITRDCPHESGAGEYSRPTRHWSDSTRRGGGQANGFMDLATTYNMPLYMMHTIRAAIRGELEEERDPSANSSRRPLRIEPVERGPLNIHGYLFHAVRGYKRNPGFVSGLGHACPGCPL